KLRLALAALDPGLAPLLAPLQAVLGLPIDEPAWPQLDPSQRRERIAESVKRLMLALAGQRSLLVVAEDLHWIDTESQAVLDRLVESLGPSHIFMLATYRPEYQHGWVTRSYYSQLRIDPLEADAA